MEHGPGTQGPFEPMHPAHQEPPWGAAPPVRAQRGPAQATPFPAGPAQPGPRPLIPSHPTPANPTPAQAGPVPAGLPQAGPGQPGSGSSGPGHQVEPHTGGGRPRDGWASAGGALFNWTSGWPLVPILILQAALSARLIRADTAFQDEALYLWAGHLEWASLLHGAALPQFPS